MKYRELNLKSVSADKLKTEIMYEVASAHIAGIELLRFNIDKTEDGQYKKVFSAITRILKVMKADGAIQFFATPALIEASSTEAQFLFNKYPQYFSEVPTETQAQSFVYVRT
jgi:hypothetical protein